jgi:Flp pilus assembly protein TadD
MRAVAGIAVWCCVAGAVAGAQETSADRERPCQVFNNAGQASDAARCYAELRAAGGADKALLRRAALGEARNQMWSGHRRRSARAYEEYLQADALDSSNRAVTIEYIRLLRYQGNYRRAEQLCDELLRTDPADAEVLALRAEVLFWAGNRSFEARRNADQALALFPNLEAAMVSRVATLEALGLNHAASAQTDALRAFAAAEPNSMAAFVEDRLDQQTRIRSENAFTVYNDSDGIHDTGYQSLLAIPIRQDHALNLSVAEFVSSAPSGSIFTDGRNRASVREFSLGGTGLVAPGLHLSLAAGGSMRDHGSLRPTYDAELTGAPGDRWTIVAGADRKFLAVTPRTIDRGIYSQDFFAGTTYWFNSHTSLAVKFYQRLWSDDNRSVQGEGAFTRNLVYGKAFNLDTGLLTHQQAFRHDMLAISGFFTPDHYSRYDGFLNLHGEAKKLSWEIRGEGGTQQITSEADFQPNWAVTARVSARLAGSLWLYGSYERKNYSLLSRDGWYQGFYASLTVLPHTN